MYQAIHYNKRDRKCWLLDDKLGWSEFYHTPTYYKKDPKGKFKTLFGDNVKAIHRYEKDESDIFEKDIDGVLSVLADKYLHEDNIPTHRQLIYDIEIEIGGQLTIPFIEEAKMPMTSFQAIDVTTETRYVYIWDKYRQLGDLSMDGVVLKTFKTEFDLLRAVLQLWKDIDPTIIIGFNNNGFDDAYMYYRMRRILGQRLADSLSPIGIVEKGYWQYNPHASYLDQPKQLVKIRGISSLDWKRLYKKFVPKKLPHYSLDYVANFEIGRGKVKYSGNLNNLFKTDPAKFIEYGLEDVELLYDLEKSKKFVDLTVQICHIAHTIYENIYYSSLVLDGVIYTSLKRKGIISPNKPVTDDPSLSAYYVKEDEDGDSLELGDDEADSMVKKKFPGAYVKPPQIGLFDWLTDEDLEALYPSNMRTLNISPETLLGRVIDPNVDYEYLGSDQISMYFWKNHQTLVLEAPDGKTTNITSEKLTNYALSRKWAISGNGIIFDTSKKGILPEVLDVWTQMRKDYKKKMLAAAEKEDYDQSAFFDRYQQVYKVFNNSIYGCLALPSFRYTDKKKWLSTATTLSGQVIIKNSIRLSNERMNSELGTDNEDFVVASDTDSMFIKCFPIVKHRYPDIDINDEDRIIPIVRNIAHELKDKINESFNSLARDYFNVTSHYFNIKPEYIIRKAYWSDKKKYACLIVDKEGTKPKPGKEWDFKGLDLMKSDFPKLYKNFMEKMLKDILKSRSKSDIDQDVIDFKQVVLKCPVVDIATPVGINAIQKYIISKPIPGNIFSRIEKGVPIHSRASVYYNDLMKFKDYDKKYPLIQEGDNIFYSYLLPNEYGIDVIAFTNDDPEEVRTFIELNADRERNYENKLLKKIQKVYDTLNWGDVNTNQFANELFKL